MNAVVDIQTLVKDKIKAAYLELIPEESWDGLVSKVTQEFLTKELPELIKTQVRIVVLEQVKAEIAKPEWQDKVIWGPNGGQTGVASQMAMEISKAISGDVLQGIISNIVMQAVGSMRNGSALR